MTNWFEITAYDGHSGLKSRWKIGVVVWNHSEWSAWWFEITVKDRRGGFKSQWMINVLFVIIVNDWRTGLRSQWMIFSFQMTFKHCSSEYAKRRMRAILKPWKLFFLISSYRFMLQPTTFLLMPNWSNRFSAVGWRAPAVNNKFSYW